MDVLVAYLEKMLRFQRLAKEMFIILHQTLVSL